MESNTEHHTHQPKLPNGNLHLPEELETMSAAQLAQAMEDALDHMTEETYDETVISAYLDALDQKAPMPDMPSTDDAWKAFQKKFKDTSRAIGASSSKHPARFRRVLRTSLVAAIVVVMLFGAMVVAQATGEDVFGAVARWTEETFRFNVSENDTATEWFADYQNELDTTGLTEEYLPKSIPEGYDVTDLQVQELNRRTEVYILYTGEIGTTFDFHILIYDAPDAIEQHVFEKDDAPVQTLQIDGKTIYLFGNLGSQTAVCQYQNAIYSLTGDISENLIEQLFASIGDE